MQNFQFIRKFIVFIGLLLIFNFGFAGSYEDFFKAVKSDNAKVVQSLLQRGFDPNTVNPEGLPGLMLALREPSLQVASLLLDWPQTRVEFRNDKDESPLMLASLKGHLPLVQKLVQRDADVNNSLPGVMSDFTYHHRFDVLGGNGGLRFQTHSHNRASSDLADVNGDGFSDGRDVARASVLGIGADRAAWRSASNSARSR